MDEQYEKRLEANRRYRLAHKDELKVKQREYYLKNRDTILKKQQERNRKTCEELKKHRQTLRNEMEKLIEVYETKLAELQQLKE